MPSLKARITLIGLQLSAFNNRLDVSSVQGSHSRGLHSRAVSHLSVGKACQIHQPIEFIDSFPQRAPPLYPVSAQRSRLHGFHRIWASLHALHPMDANSQATDHMVPIYHWLSALASCLKQHFIITVTDPLALYLTESAETDCVVCLSH